jgi:DNA-binding NarL/FixJ family response regulator
VRVVLAEDSLLVREGVQRILENEPRIELVGVYAEPDALLAAIEGDRPDVVLTDLRMPPGQRDEGILIANALRLSQPGVGVIVLSQYADPGYVIALLGGGSAGRGYLLKDRLADRKRLVDAIEEVAAGGSVVDGKVIEALVAAQAGRERSPLDVLTPREREILGEVASGKSNAAIADSLVITKRAVEHHIGSIFSKLDLPDESEVSRRVTATLVFLSETGNGTTSSSA